VTGIRLMRRIAFIALIAAALALACAKDQPGTHGTPGGGTPVQVEHPRIRDLSEFIDLNANTIFLRKEVIRATFQGFIVTIYKNIGDDVRNGDEVLAIKTKEMAADDSIRIDLGSEPFRGLVRMYARSDGVLTTLDYHNGDFVSEGEEIAVISNPSSLRFELNVPYAYVSRIDPASSCEIFLPGGRTLPATIQKIIPSVDAASQTQTFLLRSEHSVSLPENLNVTARLRLKTARGAVVVPRGAVLSNETQDEFWVMKLRNDSTAVRVPIQKGIENDSMIQVVSPLFSPGDRIISDGAYGLPDTARVTVMRTP
jgi:multidrug efflux pump subunit AcrA (membrane-fusion protein)